MKKHYINNNTGADAASAAQALYWHRRGDQVQVNTFDSRGALVNVIHLAGAAQPMEENENRAHCKHISMELDAYVNGDVRRCPDCGEIHRRDWDDVGDCFRCPDCGEVADVDTWETLGVYDFLEDVYNVEFRVSGRARDALRSVQIMVACGGPNIYLDTASGDVELYWWSDRARYPLSREAVQALDDWAEEYWCCL